jgi:heme-degrading monooxygenase HmoA
LASTIGELSHKFQVSVFARMHTLETTPDVHERGLELLDELMPWLSESNGFRGLLRLTALDRSKTVVITFWADEGALTETATSGEGISALAAEAAGSKRISLEDYEVTFLDGEFERSASRAS